MEVFMRRTSVVVLALRAGLDTWCSHANAWQIKVKQRVVKCLYEGVIRVGALLSSLVDPLGAGKGNV